MNAQQMTGEEKAEYICANWEALADDEYKFGQRGQILPMLRAFLEE